MSDPFITYDQLAADHGIPFTRVSINRMIDRGDFPAAYQLAGNRIAWKLSEIEAWKVTRRPGKANTARKRLNGKREAA
jgi:predicted DNA-binding transcriptional regulator AlpA